MDVRSTGDSCNVYFRNQFMFNTIKKAGTNKLQARMTSDTQRDSRERASPVGLWHHSMMHLNLQTLVHMLQNEEVPGILKLAQQNFQCIQHTAGKCWGDPFKASLDWQSSGLPDLVRVDVCMPFPAASLSGARYVLPIVDDYSCRIRVSHEV